MKQLILISWLFLLNSFVSYAQPKKEVVLIKHSVLTFLKWHKYEEAKFSKENYSLLQGGTLASKMNLSIDYTGVEKFVHHMKSSNLVSNNYLNGLRGYFMQIGNELEIQQRKPSDDIVKVDGLDLDIVLQSFEPELILDHIDNGVFKKVRIVGDKALVLFFIPDYNISMNFVLSKVEGVWLLDQIDYLH